MDIVTVSPKYQVVIPKDIRDSIRLKVGEKLQVLIYDNRIELVPVLPMKKMRGFIRGIRTDVLRERDRV
jgi:AbrB family looped-hinge helix DNA binding protein